MSRIPRFLVPDVKDPAVQQALDNLASFLREQSPLLNFKHFELEFTTTGTQTIPHNLGFQPKDIILTSKIGSGTITFNYGSFTKDDLSVTISGGSCTVRFFAGTYDEGVE